MHVYPSMLPDAETIKQTQVKARPLPIEPWVAANVSRLWKGIQANIKSSIVSGKLAQRRNDQ